MRPSSSSTSAKRAGMSGNPLNRRMIKGTSSKVYTAHFSDRELKLIAHDCAMILRLGERLKKHLEEVRIEAS